MKKTHFFLILIITTNIAHAQHRVDRPVQVQVNFSGLLLDVAGNAIADATVDDLTVNAWVPGFSLGYHFNRYLCVGYSMYAPLDMTLKESWGLTPNALDADITLDHQTGAIHNLQARYSPFRFGLYVAFGFANIGKVDYQMDMHRKGEELYIGNNQYPTDLEITWNSERINTPTIGFGYTHVSQNGLSFNIGMTIPFAFPDDENIIISSDVAVLPADIALAEQQIQAETFYGPVQLHLSLGYNFGKFWSKN